MKKICGQHVCYELPDNWAIEESEGLLFLYDPNGKGAMTISLLRFTTAQNNLSEQLNLTAHSFVNQNKIHLKREFCQKIRKDGTWIQTAPGETVDGDFIQIWLVAKGEHAVLASYQSEKKNHEVKICDSILTSLIFV